jgi:hypothetical protein
MNFILQLENSGFVTWVREGGSLWGYPAVLFLHTIGLATVAGLSTGITLRVLGFAPKVPLASLTRLFPVIWAAFGVTAASGITLLLTDATTKLSSPVFYVKMLFVIAALINVHLLRTRLFGDPRVDTNPLSTSAKALAFTSLVLWIGATTAGRLIAYL